MPMLTSIPCHYLSIKTPRIRLGSRMNRNSVELDMAYAEMKGEYRIRDREGDELK